MNCCVTWKNAVKDRDRPVKFLLEPWMLSDDSLGMRRKKNFMNALKTAAGMAYQTTTLMFASSTRRIHLGKDGME
jgi:hypothetical protein